MNIRNLLKTTMLVVAAFGFAGSAYAVTPANSLLTNQAKLTYTGNTTTGITASVSVEVQLVEAGVTAISAPDNVTLTEGQVFSDTFIIQSNANGPDSYTLTAEVTDADNDITGEDTTVDFSGFSTAFTLGASALAADIVIFDASFTVPGDGVTGGGVNGLAGGDYIVLSGKYYQIDSVSENADPTLPATVNIDAFPTGGPAGLSFETSVADNLSTQEGVYEITSFTTTIDPVGNQAVSGVEGEIFLDINITNGTASLDFDADTGQTLPDARVQITVVRVEFVKYVRNDTADDSSGVRSSFEGDCASGGAETITYQGETYYLTEGTCEVQVLPADALEFYLRIKADDSSDITQSIVADTLPDFTTYTSSTTKLNNIAVADEGGSGFPLADTADDGGLLIQDDAAAAQATNDEGSGAVTQGQTAHVVYQITVDDT